MWSCILQKICDAEHTIGYIEEACADRGADASCMHELTMHIGHASMIISHNHEQNLTAIDRRTKACRCYRQLSAIEFIQMTWSTLSHRHMQGRLHGKCMDRT